MVQTDFDDDFRKLRNQLRQYNPESLITAASKKLRELERLPVQDWGGWVAWDLLLLIRWALLHGGEKYPPKPVDGHALVKLANLVKKVGSTNPFLAEKAEFGLHKTFRTLSFQQFWFQHALSKADVGRQSLMFGRLQKNSVLRQNIVRATGLEPDVFCDLLLILIFVAQAQPTTIFLTDVFSGANYRAADMNQFFAYLAPTFDDLRDSLRKDKRAIRAPILQVLDRTPLVRYPLLKKGKGTVLLYAGRVLEETYKTLVYDAAKEVGGSEVAEEFGSLMERYIEQGLQHAKVSYYTEKELASAFGAQKVTDFAVPLDEATALIEVKAGDVRPIVKVFPEKKELINELEDNVLKGIEQGFSLASRIARDADSLDFKVRDEFYLLVVSHRNLYLGPPEEAWKEFISSGIEARLEANGVDPRIIPPDHIFVLSLEEYDELVRVLAEPKYSLGAVLKSAVAANTDPQKRKFTFLMHLSGFPTTNSLPYLDNEVDRVFNRIEAAVRH